MRELLDKPLTMNASIKDADLKQGIVYTLSDPTTGKVRYVGQTIQPEKRYGLHLWSAKRESTHKEKWIKSLLSKGRLPKMDIIWEGNISEIDAKEIQFISLFKSIGAKLTNATIGGKTTAGRKCSQETKDKLSKMFAGICLRPPITDKERENASKRMTGFKHTEQSKALLSVGRIGKPSYWSTNVMPQLMKDTIADRGRKCSKKVIAIIHGSEIEYVSTKEAENKTGVDRKTIREIANGIKKQSKGYQFQFA